MLAQGTGGHISSLTYTSRSGLASAKTGSLFLGHESRDEWFSVPPLEPTSHGTDEPVLSSKQKADGQCQRGCSKHPLTDPPRSLPQQLLPSFHPFCRVEELFQQKGFKIPGSLMIRALIKNATLPSIPVLKSSRA